MNDSIPTRKPKAIVSEAEKLSEDLLEEATPENSQKFLAFCQEQIDKMLAQSKIRCVGDQPGYDSLNRALMDWQSINNGLIYLYEAAKDEEHRASEQFEDWYAEKYTQERELLNPRTLSSQKWLSQREIELHIRHKFKNEFKKLNDEKQYASLQIAFLRRLLDGWSNQHFILARLSKNVDSEVAASTGMLGKFSNGND